MHKGGNPTSISTPVVDCCFFFYELTSRPSSLPSLLHPPQPPLLCCRCCPLHLRRRIFDSPPPAHSPDGGLALADEGPSASSSYATQPPRPRLLLRHRCRLRCCHVRHCLFCRHIVVSFLHHKYFLHIVKIIAVACIKVGIPPAFPHQWLIVVSFFTS